MKSICFFNNKGGVGKTTLACNVASAMANFFNLGVLFVDADPQCNATQLVLANELLEPLYKNRQSPLGESKGTGSRTQTLFDVLRPIAKGEAGIADTVKTVRASKNRFGIDILPGHPRVALLEDRLSQAWVEFGSGVLGGTRQTNWSTELLTHVEDDYDVVFFDVGPSLGALNRSVLVGVDYFVTPMGCDIFSIMGIANISEWLRNWTRVYDRGLGASREQWGTELDDYAIRDFTESPLRFAGYTVQQYVAKSISGERRPTKAYEKILKRIPTAISRHMAPYVDDSATADALRLGDVPNMYSLVPLAQDNNVPIHGIESKDGLVGAQYSQKETYAGFVRNLTESILNNIDVEYAK